MAVQYLDTSSFHGEEISSTVTGTHVFELVQASTFLCSHSAISPGSGSCCTHSSMGVVASKGDGMKLSDTIKLPEMVKARVFEALCSLHSRTFEGHHLPADLMLLCATEQQVNHQHYWHECLQLPTCSQAILVWHIATSLCEMKLAQDSGMDLSNKEELLIDEKSLDGDLRTNYEVANSLSRYCAYLLVARPDLLPDTILVPKVILQKAVSQARGMLRDCDSVQSVYKKLLAVAQDEPSVQDRQDRKLSINVVQRGAVLGRKLIEDEHHWELLAKVWVNLLVHIAPSSNAEAHAKYLEFGGEFVTLVWALFCHCGIERSQLWQEKASTSSNSSPGSPSQQSNGCLAPTTQVQQTAVASAPAAALPDGHASDLESGGDTEEVMETSPTPQGTSL